MLVETVRIDDYEVLDSRHVVDPDVKQMTNAFQVLVWDDAETLPYIGVSRYPLGDDEHISMTVTAEIDEVSGERMILVDLFEKVESDPQSRFQCDITNEPELGLELLTSFLNQDENYRRRVDWDYPR
ncbi:MAG: hypothetical protein AAF456_24310 [Planctomycetota bacterium]